MRQNSRRNSTPSSSFRLSTPYSREKPLSSASHAMIGSTRMKKQVAQIINYNADSKPCDSRKNNDANDDLLNSNQSFRSRKSSRENSERTLFTFSNSREKQSTPIESCPTDTSAHKASPHDPSISNSITTQSQKYSKVLDFEESHSAVMSPVPSPRPQNRPQSESRRIFSWGWNGFGQCGIGEVTTSVSIPTPIEQLARDRIADFSAAAFHSVAVTGDGMVYAWGKNDCMQLGVPNSTTSSLMRSSNRKSSSFSTNGISDGLFPRETRNGIFGENQTSPTPVRVLSLSHKCITRVACGSQHTLALSEGGEVFAWGRCDSGQLGVRLVSDSMSSSSLPVHVADVPRAKDIACGFESSYVITFSGKVYSFGGNSHGQLGHGDLRNASCPRQITGLEDKELVSCISCGDFHVLFLTTSGTVYSCGEADFGRLGYMPSESERQQNGMWPVPSVRKVNFPTNSEIILIEAGGASSAALTESGSLFSWGCNSFGQLGHGHRDNVTSPQLLEAFEESRVSISTMSIGEDHMCALSKSGNVYVWGRSSHARLAFNPESECQTTPYLLEYFAREGIRVNSIVLGGAHALSGTLIARASTKRSSTFPQACVLSAHWLETSDNSSRGLLLRLPVGVSHTLILQARDHSLKPRTVGGDKIYFSLDIPQSISTTSNTDPRRDIDIEHSEAKSSPFVDTNSLLWEHTTTDNHDGTYSIRFTCYEQGVYLMSVKLCPALSSRLRPNLKFSGSTVDEQATAIDVLDSPFQISFVQDTDPLECKASGKGLHRAIAGHQNTFRIKAYAGGKLQKSNEDKFISWIVPRKIEQQITGLVMSTTNGENVTTSLTTDEIDEQAISFVNIVGRSGIYEGIYKCDKAGLFDLYIRLLPKSGDRQKAIDIQSSPFDLKIVPDVTHPPSSIIENHVGSVCRLGSSISFEIQARDRFENARQCGGDRLRVLITGACSFEGTVHDLDNGCYVVEVVPPCVGSYSIVAMMNGERMKGFPFSLQVEQNECCPFKSTVLITSNKATREGVLNHLDANKHFWGIFPGSEITCIIQARDVEGNATGINSDVLSVNYTIGSHTRECHTLIEPIGTFSGDFSVAIQFTDSLNLIDNMVPIANIKLNFKIDDTDIQRSPLHLTIAHPSTLHFAKNGALDFDETVDEQFMLVLKGWNSQTSLLSLNKLHYITPLNQVDDIGDFLFVIFNPTVDYQLHNAIEHLDTQITHFSSHSLNVALLTSIAHIVYVLTPQLPIENLLAINSDTFDDVAVPISQHFCQTWKKGHNLDEKPNTLSYSYISTVLLNLSTSIHGHFGNMTACEALLQLIWITRHLLFKYFCDTKLKELGYLCKIECSSKDNIMYFNCVVKFGFKEQMQLSQECTVDLCSFFPSVRLKV